MTVPSWRTAAPGSPERVVGELLHDLGVVAGVLAVGLGAHALRGPSGGGIVDTRFRAALLAVLLGALSWAWTAGWRFPRATMAVRALLVGVLGVTALAFA